MNKKGFSLIEIIIALLIGSIVMIITYQAFRTLSSGAARLDKKILMNDSLTIAHDQLLRDINGIHVPNHFLKQDKTDAKNKKDSDVKNKLQQKSGDIKQNDGQEEQEDSNTAKKDKEPLFRAVTQEGQFESLTFWTTNSLSQYGTSVSSPVCVVYTFTRYEHDGQSLRKLMRQEVDSSHVQDLKTAAAYSLLDNVLQCTVTFITFTQEQAQSAQEKSEQAEQNKQKTKVIQNNWTEKNSDQVHQEHAQKDKGEKIPHFIAFEGELYDTKSHNVYPFSWLFEVGAQAYTMGSDEADSTTLEPPLKPGDDTQKTKLPS
jgi:prepilin-type N-terminal cleavage/methylation domain-containing protein